MVKIFMLIILSSIGKCSVAWCSEVEKKNCQYVKKKRAMVPSHALHKA